MFFWLCLIADKVGVSGFEPPLSRPPDAHFNRTKLHPVLCMRQINTVLHTLSASKISRCEYTKRAIKSPLFYSIDFFMSIIR